MNSDDGQKSNFRKRVLAGGVLFALASVIGFYLSRPTDFGVLGGFLNVLCLWGTLVGVIVASASRCRSPSQIVKGDGPSLLFLLVVAGVASNFQYGAGSMIIALAVFILCYFLVVLPIEWLMVRVIRRHEEKHSRM